MNKEEIVALQNEALDALNKAQNRHELDVVKSVYVGKSGKLTELLKQLKDLTVEVRPVVGGMINEAKTNFLAKLNERIAWFDQQELNQKLASEKIDLTLPARGEELGALHPVTKMRHILEEFFQQLGFHVVTGPEIETDFYNFTALNIPAEHPARLAHDTFYFADGKMLRSQTSTVQIRTMELTKPPLRVISPGRVFRRDNDATHSPMFHQIEGLVVDRQVTFANLKWMIIRLLRFLFGEQVEYRFRPSYFPFTEPSAEFDIKWRGAHGERWLELGGSGMVHPNVLKAVQIDPNEYRGFAFAFGIDRLAMCYYGIDDIRRLFENDQQFLKQFVGRG